GARFSGREAASLLSSGLRERLCVPAAAASPRSQWAAGCRLAALALLLLTAAAGAHLVAFDVWYGRLAITWPHSAYHLYFPPMSNEGLVRTIAATTLPLIAAFAVCRGRLRIASLFPLALAALYITGEVGFAAQQA